jgi:hypothetical protein
MKIEDCNEYYIQGSDHYLIPKEVLEELYYEMVSWREDYKKLKEVIDKAIKYIDDLRDESAERQGFYNCFPDDLYIADINELLDILKEASE